MKKIFSVFAILVVIFSCEKGPCDDPINGPCPYPEISDDIKGEQRYKALNLSEETLDCITTEGLVETCLNYPEFYLIWIRTPLQRGYDYIRSIFNGLRELEVRNDAPKFLLKKYLSLNPRTDTVNMEIIQKGEYSFKIVYLALIFSQSTNLEPLTTKEKIELIEKSNYLYDQLTNDYLVLNPIVILMGRLMYKDGYEPLINVYNKNSLLKFCLSNCILINELRIMIKSMSDNYLVYLKNQ